MGADGDVETVVIALQLVEGNVFTHGDAGVCLDTGGEDGCDLRVQLLPGEAIGGNAVAQHAAQLVALFEDGDLVAHQCQIIRAAQTAGAAADDSHLLAGGCGALRLGNIAGVVHGVALQIADIDGVIDHAAAAAGLTGMLANISAGHRHGIVLADQAHGVGAAAFAHQCHVAGDIHTGGAQGHTGHRHLQTGQTPVVADVLLIIIPESLQTVDHQTGGVATDSAVGGIDDGTGRLFDDVQGGHRGAAVQHLLDELAQLSQTDTAGDAFAAALGVAHLQKGVGHVHRAQAGRAGLNMPFHITVQVFQHRLCAAGGFDVKSAQIRSLLSTRAISCTDGLQVI